VLRAEGKKGLGARGTGGFIRCGVRGTGNARTQIARGTPGGWARVWLLDFAHSMAGALQHWHGNGMVLKRQAFYFWRWCV
jgi:hypothetical protein